METTTQRTKEVVQPEVHMPFNKDGTRMVTKNGKTYEETMKFRRTNGGLEIEVTSEPIL